MAHEAGRLAFRVAKKKKLTLILALYNHANCKLLYKHFLRYFFTFDAPWAAQIKYGPHFKRMWIECNILLMFFRLAMDTGVPEISREMG